MYDVWMVTDANKKAAESKLNAEQRKALLERLAADPEVRKAREATLQAYPQYRKKRPRPA